MSVRRDFEGFSGTFFQTTDGTPTGYAHIRPKPDGDVRWFMPLQLVTGEYDGMGIVGKANIQDWKEMFEEGEDDWWTIRYEHYSTRAVVIDMDADNIPDEAFEVLSALQNYFVINDDTVSQLQMEAEDEAWEKWARKDFGDEVEKIFDIELEDDDLDEIFEIGRERANEYWDHTSEGPFIDVQKVAMALHEEDFEDFEE